MALVHLLLRGSCVLMGLSIINSIPTQPPCKYPVDCLGLPCVYNPICEAHPEAVCVPDSCGCTARYYIGDTEVSCNKNIAPWLEVGESITEKPSQTSHLNDFPIKYSCPSVLPSFGAGICMSNCETDDNCGAAQKCCSNGCGKMCMNGVIPQKYGSCPLLNVRGPCFKTCAEHAHCEGNRLCCSNGCGMECKPPV